MNPKMFQNILLGLILFLLFTSLLGFYGSIKPPKIVSTITPKELGLDYEKVTLNTADGLSLSGWFIPNETTKQTIILLHGYPADKGDVLPSLAFLNKRYNLFLFDFRYLGRSEGEYSTAGAKEIADLSSAIEYLKTRGINEVGVWGFSMGGAVALMSIPSNPEIKAVVSEASYSSLGLMARELYRIPLLDYPLAWLTGVWVNLFIGVNLGSTSPEDAVRNTKIPVLIIHSKNDDVIPFKNALLLQDALKNNPRAEFWFQENLVHGQFDAIYQKKIGEFFLNNL